MKRLTVRAIAILLAISAGLAVTACDSGEDFRYENETSQALFVQPNDSSFSGIPAGKTRTITDLTSEIGSGDDPLRFLVVNEAGCTVLKVETTLEDFKRERDLTLTIEESEITPVVSRTECDSDVTDILRQASD